MITKCVGVVSQVTKFRRICQSYGPILSVRSQFQDAWSGDERSPEVRAIYEVVRTKVNDTKYGQYLSVLLPIATFLTLINAHGYSDRIEGARSLASDVTERGNEQHKWIGSRRKCLLGDEGMTDFCQDTSCELCYTTRLTLGNMRITATASSSRYVRMLSSALELLSNSLCSVSRSNLYSQNESPSGWKALLMSKVVIGRGYPLDADGTAPTELPNDYDSVSTVI